MRTLTEKKKRNFLREPSPERIKKPRNSWNECQISIKTYGDLLKKLLDDLECAEEGEKRLTLSSPYNNLNWCWLQKFGNLNLEDPNKTLSDGAKRSLATLHRQWSCFASCRAHLKILPKPCMWGDFIRICLTRWATGLDHLGPPFHGLGIIFFVLRFHIEICSSFTFAHTKILLGKD